MSAPVIGFVGFGEAARCFVRHLSASTGRAPLVFCAGRTNRPPYSEAFLHEVWQAGAGAVASLDELLALADVVVSAVTASRFSAFVDMCIRTDVLHAERRAAEMDGVAEGIRELGIDPVMSVATASRLRRSAALGCRDRFLKRGDYTADDVLDAYVTPT